MDPRDVAVKEAIGIVNDARQRAMALLNEAQVEAKTILQNTENVKSETHELFEQKIQQIGQKNMMAFDAISQDLLNSYKAVLGQEKDTSIKTLMDVSTSLKQELTSEVHSFSENIRKVANETEEVIRNDMKNQYGQVSAEMSKLSENLRYVTQETEQSMKDKLGEQFGLVQAEISSLSTNIKKITEDTEVTIKNGLMQEYQSLKEEVGGIAEGIKSVTQETEALIKGDITKEYESAKIAVHDFSASLKEAALETENSIREDIRREFEGVKREIGIYRDERYKKIDSAVGGMLEEVARDVIGKTMNTKDHEGLIIKSLDSIKRTTNLKEL